MVHCLQEFNDVYKLLWWKMNLCSSCGLVFISYFLNILKQSFTRPSGNSYEYDVTSEKSKLIKVFEDTIHIVGKVFDIFQ